jgi:predicted AlkP superfamily phosphohydrolase/phosphomutase
VSSSEHPLRKSLRRSGARLGGIALVAGLLACSAGTVPAQDTRKVVLVALDGASWRVIDPLLAAGELPNLESLISRGCRGRLKSLRISSSARIWTSVATGAAPAVHGIRDFTQQVEGERRLFTALDVRVPRIWELASDAGIPVGVTNWWFTYPAAPLNGFIISDHAIPSRSERTVRIFAAGSSAPPDPAALVYPSELWREFEDLTLNPPPTPRQRAGEPAQRRAYLAEDIRREDQQILELALRGADAHSPGLQLVYFKGVDRASHRFWREYEPDHPSFATRPPIPERITRYGEAIPDAYRTSDELVGRLTEGLGEDDVVILVSDHGFEAATAAGDSTGTHGISEASIDGIYIVAGGPIDRRSCPAEISLYDVAPLALYLVGVAIPGHMQGEVPPKLFAPETLAATPVVWTAPIAAATRSHPTAPVDPIETERIERLRALGYFDDAD